MQPGTEEATESIESTGSTGDGGATGTRQRRAATGDGATGDGGDVSSWVTDEAGGATLEVLVQPRASRTRVVGEHDGRLKIQLAAPPVDGEANAALVAFLAAALSVRRQDVAIVRGETGRRKVVRVAGVTAARAEAALRG